MHDLQITDNLTIPRKEIDLTAIRSQGPGGQNVNKVATGIHLRFDIRASSLPEYLKIRLLQSPQQHINKDGIVVIKAQQSRSQEQNRTHALQNLQTLIKTAMATPKPRKKTRPSKNSMKKRIETKKLRGKIKELRQKVLD